MIVNIDFRKIFDELLTNPLTLLEFDKNKENDIVIPVLSSHFRESKVVIDPRFFEDNIVYYEYNNKPKYYYIDNYKGYKINIWEDFPTKKRFKSTIENINKELKEYNSLIINDTIARYNKFTVYIKKKKRRNKNE